MSKYKKGDKLVIKIAEVFEGTLGSGYTVYKLDNNTFITPYKYKLESLSEYTEPLENRINELIEENNKLKEQLKLMNMLDAPTLISEEDKRRMDINKARAEGAEAAWELARKIVDDVDNGGYRIEDLIQIFGLGSYSACILSNTYPEAAAKLAEWEKAKEEIKAGDIVKIHEGNDNDLCVLYVSTDKKYYNAVDEYGAVYNMLTKGMITKTGRHIDIDSFLKQIGEEE